jgi:transposase
LKQFTAGNEVCQRWMEIPGIGPITALTFYAVVSDPHRFDRAVKIGSYLGLTPRMYQSGMSLRVGRISRMGNAPLRSLLVGASSGFLKFSPDDCQVRAWTLKIEHRRGRRKARVALARKLAVIMLAMWKSGEPYKRWRISPPLVESAPDGSVELDFARASACAIRANGS